MYVYIYGDAVWDRLIGSTVTINSSGTVLYVRHHKHETQP